MVLKTGLDRPVRPVGPPISHRFGPVIRPDGDRTGIGPLEPDELAGSEGTSRFR